MIKTSEGRMGGGGGGMLQALNKVRFVLFARRMLIFRDYALPLSSTSP